jgi:hypothetical protein
LAVAVQGEGCSLDDAGEISSGLDGRSIQVDFQRGGVREIADQGIPQGEREPIRGPADRHPQTPARRPAEIHDQRVQAGLEDA